MWKEPNEPIETGTIAMEVGAVREKSSPEKWVLARMPGCWGILSLFTYLLMQYVNVTQLSR